MQNLFIVIPTLNAENQLKNLLPKLQGLKVMVVDGGSTDATQEVAQVAKAKWLNSEKGRGFQIANGIDKGREMWGSKNWILILHADTQLDNKALTAVTKHINDEAETAGYFKLTYRSNSKFAKLNAWLANWRSSKLGLPYGDQGLLIHQKLLAEVGGYPRQSLMEDVVLAKALGKARLICLGGGLSTDAEKFEAGGWLRRSFVHLSCLAMYFYGAKQATITRHYNKFSKP